MTTFTSTKAPQNYIQYIWKMKVEKINKKSNFINIYVLCSLTGRQTVRLFREYMLIDQKNLHKKKSDFYLK